MRFTSFHVEAFGRFRDWRADDIDPGLVVVLGRNEAGKSTLFRFLTTMLYGIYPADSEANPYVPWNGERTLAGSALLTLSDGTRLRVHRRLLRQPQGAMELLGPAQGPEGEPTVVRREELRNRALPATNHIPKRLFEDVFALTLEEMRFPSDQAWNLIHDRLLGHLGTDAFRPVNDVLAELRQEADRLWRPDRRGRPEDRRLEDEIARVRELRQEAARRDEEIRRIYRRLAALKEEREQLKRREVELQAYLRRATRLFPVYRTLKSIDELRAAAGDLSPWAHVPDDPVAAAEALNEELTAHADAMDELEREMEACRDVMEEVHPGDPWLLEHEGEVQRAVDALARLDAMAARREETARSEEQARTRLADAAQRLLAEPWTDGMAEVLAAIPEGELRQSLQAYREEDQRYREALARRQAVQAHEVPPLAGLTPGWAAIITLAGLALSFLGGIGAMDMLLWGGLLLALIGMIQLWIRWQERNRHRRERARRRRLEHEAAVAEREAALRRDEALRTIEALFAGLPIDPARLEAPDETLLVDVQHIQLQERAWRDVIAEGQRLDEQIAAARDEVRALFEEMAAAGAVAYPQLEEDIPPLADTGDIDELLLDGSEAVEDAAASGAVPAPEAIPWDDVEEAIRRLPQRLQDARARQDARERARERLAQLEQEKERLHGRYNATVRRLAALKEALAPLGDTLEAQAAELRRRRDAARDADALADHLRRQYPDLEELKKEIAAARRDEPGWNVTDEAVVEAETELKAVREQWDRLGDEMSRLSQHAKGLEAQPTLDQVDGELAALEEERERIRRQRDRLVVLARVLQEADRRFRDEHQPDVLRRAGEYLDLITGGRYVRLFLEPTDKGERLTLQERGNPFPYPVEDVPISRGTLDQIYLALRLAVIDHLDADQEPMPLFLDEVFVNWDEGRRERALLLLDQVSGRRQVFLFTCHEWFVEQVTSQLSAQTLVLPAEDLIRR